MSRKSKFSKEVKILACENYKAGNGSYQSIANSIGANLTTVREWYSAYINHGPSAFDSSNRNKSYSKEFKMNVIKSYLSDKYSCLELSGKYNIALSMVKRWIKMYNNGIEIKDYDPKGDIYTMKSRKTTFEERLEIVKWVIANDMNYKEAANKYGIKYALVYKWTKDYTRNGISALEYKKRGPKPKSSVNEDSLDDIEKLKLELERERALRKRREFELKVLKKKEEFELKLHSQK